MPFDDDEVEEFNNEPIEGQMSIFELPVNEPEDEEDSFTNQPVNGQLDLFSYYHKIKNDNIPNKTDNINKPILNHKQIENSIQVDNDEPLEIYNAKETNKLNNDDKYNNKESNKNNNDKYINEIAEQLDNNNSQSKIADDSPRVTEEEVREDLISQSTQVDNEKETQEVYYNESIEDDDQDNKANVCDNSKNQSDVVEQTNEKQFENDVDENDGSYAGDDDGGQNVTTDQTSEIEFEETNEDDQVEVKDIDVSISNKKTNKKINQKGVENMAYNDNNSKKADSTMGGGKKDGGLLLQSIDEVLHNSMIPYSEFVLLDRALPRVEDGLKPVQRRILYTMIELGMTPDKSYRKCAKVVGDCLGKYHPHGDTSVYDAMVRMAQPFNMRGILVQGHGNFGSVDGDSAAAMRYTEAKLAPLALELLRDLDKETVDWSFNFDDTLKEPDTLPGRFPNLLVNGAVGIAVGLATNIPPHNLNEVIDGVLALIDRPSITLKEMMKIIKGPDFPTGAIVSSDELYQAYETGKGKITVRAKTHFEDAGNGKTNIVITEIPYQKNKASLLAKIVDIREDKKGVLLGIQDIKDESDRNGTRAVITVKAGYNPNDILNLLYKYSDLQSTFGINMVAIADGKPKQLGLMEILKYYLNYQIEVIVRRTKFDLSNAKERMHILEGLHIAIVNIDEVVQIIKTSPNTTEAKVRLKQRFLLSEKQAQAILDMRLARLTSLEVYKIEQEIAELKILIEKLTAILNSKRLQLEVIKDEMSEIKRKHSMPRLTKVVKAFDEIDVESILEANKVVEETVVAITQSGTVKRMQPKHFESTVKEFNSEMSENELHFNILKTTTDKVLVAFTNKGNACRINVEDIKEVKWRDKGTAFRNLCKELDVDEKILAIFEMVKDSGRKLIFATKNGMLKRTDLAEYNISKQKYSAIKLKDDDQVISVFEVDKKHTIMMISKYGMALNCEIENVPESGRVSQGVKGMNLNENDCLAYCGLAPLNGEIIFATKQGLGKRFSLGFIELSQRARKGTKIFALQGNDEICFVDISKTDSNYAIKFNGADNFVKRGLKEFFPDKKIGKGKSLTASKTGNKIVSIYKIITE